MNASDSHMNLHKLRRPSSEKENESQPDSDQYWEAAAWHYNKDSAENQHMNDKIERAYGLELLKIPRTAGQVGFLEALREVPCLHLTVGRKRGRVLLCRRLILLFYRCRLGAAAKKHRRDAMANS